tara:strand:+ start:330 stop:557 length:228 start_codon:yes stop_codon:yes gene_type:complete
LKISIKDNTMPNDKYSVLLHFRGNDKFLYEQIRKDADEEQLPVSRYMRYLMKAGLNKDIVIRKNINEETENREKE